MMDIERFKRLSIPKIEAGKMTEVVRDVIKEVRSNKQNVYEKTSEDLKPLKNNQSKPVPKMLISAKTPKSVLSVNSGDSSHRSVLD